MEFWSIPYAALYSRYSHLNGNQYIFNFTQAKTQGSQD